MICCKIYFDLTKAENLDGIINGLNEIGDLYAGSDVIFFKSLLPKVNKTRVKRELTKYGVNNCFISEISRPDDKSYDPEQAWVRDYYNSIDKIEIEEKHQDQLREMKKRIDTVLAILQTIPEMIKQKGGVDADGREGTEEEGETEEEGADL